MIEGETKNIALSPKGYKDLDPIENFIPTHIDLRNGFLSDAGNWHKRAGYDEEWDVGIDKKVHALIPESSGYAITDSGRVFNLSTATPVEMTGKAMNGSSRPTWTNFDGTIAVVDGGDPIKIVSGVTSALGGSPSKFRFIDRIGPYTIGCGHDDTEFKWCAAGNIENWTTGDSGFANVQKEGDNDKIKNFGAIKNKGYFFKGDSIEIWYNRGGTTPFARVDLIERGIKADYSLVKESNTFYWLGDDLRFYRLDGINPVPISSPYESYIQELINPFNVYGFKFAKEHLIKWVVPEDGKTLIYDYRNDNWSEDNRWEHGQWERIPMASYMELNNKQYFGSYNLDGLIYKVSPDSLDDAGQPIRVFRKMAVKLTQSGNSARCDRLGFRFKGGVATASEPDPKFFWRHRFDKGNWSNFDEVSIGSYDPYVERYGLGVGRELEIEVIQTDAVEYILTNMDLTVQELVR